MLYIRVIKFGKKISFSKNVFNAFFINDFCFGHYFHCVIFVVLLTCDFPYFTKSSFSNDMSEYK